MVSPVPSRMVITVVSGSVVTRGTAVVRVIENVALSSRIVSAGIVVLKHILAVPANKVKVESWLPREPGKD